MKPAVRALVKAFSLLAVFTLIGFLLSSLCVYWLLERKASAWIINNAVFFITMTGFLVGVVAMARTIATEYFPAYRKQVIEEENKEKKDAENKQSTI